MREIYLDNAATTRPWPEVIDAVVRAMGDGFGNASSPHRRGLAAASAVDGARRRVLEAVGSGKWELAFTSGGCESDTTAVLGCVPRGRRDGIVISSVEHSAVEEACAAAAEAGARVTKISAGASGMVDVAEIAAAVDDRTALVALIHVANEMGTVQPVAEAARAVKRIAPRCRVHVDAVQALAQLPRLDYPREVDTLAISAHKIHGPQGVGALLYRPESAPRPLIRGGDQQRGVRPGTLDAAGISGFGEAARLLVERRERGARWMRELTDLLLERVGTEPGGVRTLGDPARRAPGIAVLAVAGARSEVLLHALEAEGVLASAGSACHASSSEPPRCLREAGLEGGEAALRISLSFDTTREEIEAACAAFASAVRNVRSGRAGAGG
jgi:cysteine desulfurase